MFILTTSSPISIFGHVWQKGGHVVKSLKFVVNSVKIVFLTLYIHVPIVLPNAPQTCSECSFRQSLSQAQYWDMWGHKKEVIRSNLKLRWNVIPHPLEPTPSLLKAAKK